MYKLYPPEESIVPGDRTTALAFRLGMKKPSERRASPEIFTETAFRTSGASRFHYSLWLPRLWATK